MLITGYWDILDINEDLIDGNVVIASNFEFYLHGFDQNIIHTLMICMKFFFLVVNTVEEVFEMRYF